MFGHGGGITGILEVPDDDTKLVTTQAGQFVIRPEGMAQPFRDASQELVADAVPQCLVDRLEVIDIQEQDRGPTVVLGRLADCPADQVLERGTVRQRRQGIVADQEFESLLDMLVIADIGKDTRVMCHAPTVIPDNGTGSHRREDLASLAPVPDLALPEPLAFDIGLNSIVERLVMAAGPEDVGFLADDFVGGIAG